MAYQIEKLTDLLIEQYKNSPNVLRLVQEIQSMFQARMDILCQLERLWNPEEAFGYWLDYLGLRLGIRRPSILNVDARYFGFDTEDTENNNLGFDQGAIQSINPDLVARTGLNDQAFLRWIRARALFIRNDNIASLHNIRQAFDILFNEGEITTFVVENYTGVLGGGPRNTLSVEISQNVNSEYFRVVMENLDSLVPRPSGVTINLTQATG